MIAHQEQGYKFVFRSGGVVVLKGDEYVDFFETLEAALDGIFGR